MLLAAAVAKAPPADVAAIGMPSFYVVADHGQPDVEVRNATTGNLLGTVPLPAAADPKLTLAAASADDRTFALAAFSLSAGTRFYELKVSASGQPVHGIALTPDGTRLAMVIQQTGMQGTMPVVKRETIEVVNLATSAARTWSHPGSGSWTPRPRGPRCCPGRGCFRRPSDLTRWWTRCSPRTASTSSPR